MLLMDWDGLGDINKLCCLSAKLFHSSLVCSGWHLLSSLCQCTRPKSDTWPSWPPSSLVLHTHTAHNISSYPPNFTCATNLTFYFPISQAHPTQSSLELQTSKYLTSFTTHTRPTHPVCHHGPIYSLNAYFFNWIQKTIILNDPLNCRRYADIAQLFQKLRIV